MNIEMFIELIPVAYNTAAAYEKKGIDIELLYSVFNNKDLTTREKRTYLYDLPILTRRNKDTIWNAYYGDDMNEYADIPDIHYEYYVEGDKRK